MIACSRDTNGNDRTRILNVNLEAIDALRGSALHMHAM